MVTTKAAAEQRKDALVDTQHTIAKKGTFLALIANTPKNMAAKRHKERFRSLRT